MSLYIIFRLKIKGFHLDTIIVSKDYPNYGIKKGDTGVIVMIHTKPNLAYEVEFSDEVGRTIVSFPIREEELVRYK